MTTRRSPKSRRLGTTPETELLGSNNNNNIINSAIGTSTEPSLVIRRSRSTDDVLLDDIKRNDYSYEDDDNNGKLKSTKITSTSIGLLSTTIKTATTAATASTTATTPTNTTSTTTETVIGGSSKDDRGIVPTAEVLVQESNGLSSTGIEMTKPIVTNNKNYTTTTVPVRYDSIQNYNTTTMSTKSTDIIDKNNDIDENDIYNKTKNNNGRNYQGIAGRHHHGDVETHDNNIQQQQQQHWKTHNFSNENDQILPQQHQKDCSSTTNNTVVSWFVIKITIIASIGGILFGYDLGVISNALPQLTKSFNLVESQQELVVSILYIGGGIGAMIGGSLCDTIGRKTTILVTDIIFLVGSLLLSIFATHYSIILLGRVVLGIGIAISGIADVSYLHEIAPINVRGAIVSVNEACISLGFLLSFCVGTIYSTTDNGWKYMFGFSSIFALLQFIGMLSLPESPKWLQECGKYNESQIALRIIHSEYVHYTEVTNTTTTTATTSAIIDNSPDNQHHHQYQEQQFLNEKYQADHNSGIHPTPTLPPPSSLLSSTNHISDNGNDGIFRSNLNSNNNINTSTSSNSIGTRLCQLPITICISSLSFIKVCFVQYYKQSIITLFLAITQQFCGQTNVISYAPSILARVSSSSLSNVSNNNNNRFLQDQIMNDDSVSSFIDGWSTLSIGIVKFIVTVLVVWKIEHIGRRTLLLCGMTIISIGLLLLTIAFTDTSSFSSISSSSNSDTTSTSSSTTTASIALGGVILVVTGYSMSFGPLSWLLTSELFPTEIRGRALGASTIVTYLCASFVTNTFLSSQTMFGSSTVFAFYMCITILGMIFAYFAIPDTGGINYDDITSILDTMPWWKFGR